MNGRQSLLKDLHGHRASATPLHGDASGRLPARQGVSEAESRRAADSALEAYVAAFRGDVAPEESALDAEHRKALRAGDRAFRAIAVGDEAVQEASLQRFRDQASAAESRPRCRRPQ